MGAKMIVSDLDNTLLNGKKEITDYTRNILAACQEKGIVTAFATARAERVTKFRADFTPEVLITNNGANISHKGRFIYSNPIPNHVYFPLISDLLHCPAVRCVSMETGDRIYNNYKGPSWGEGWNLHYTDFHPIPDATVVKITVEFADLSGIDEILRNYPSLQLQVFQGESWLFISDHQTSKGLALEKAAARLDIPLTEVVAFGDDSNDLDLLQKAGTGIAVANAIDDVKAAADAICLSNEEDGVARWIEKHLL